MIIKGETIATGASRKCSDCGETPPLEVLRSPAGSYIGTRCQCGPFSRESGYYKTDEEAKAALNNNTYKRTN